MFGTARISVPALAFVLLAQALAAQADLKGSPSEITAIRAGRLIDGRGGSPVANAVILIVGQRIVAVGPGVPIPGGARGGPNPLAKGYLAGMKDTTGEFKIGPFKTRPRNLIPDNLTGTGRFSERQIFNALRFGLRPGETPDVEITSTTPGQGNFPAVGDCRVPEERPQAREQQGRGQRGTA